MRRTYSRDIPEVLDDSLCKGFFRCLGLSIPITVRIENDDVVIFWYV